MTTPTPPVGSTRPGNRGLATATAALAAALAVALATGVLKPPSAPPAASASAFGCPDSAAGAIVIHFADATTGGVVPRPDITPPVICGPASIAFAMQTYIGWETAGPCPCNNGGARDTTPNRFDKVVLSPADTSASLWDNPDSVLTRRDSLHWIVPSAARLRWKSLGGLLYNVMGQAQVAGITDSTPVPVIGWWSYVPTKGGLLRTQLTADRAITDTSAVLNMTLTRSASLAMPGSTP